MIEFCLLCETDVDQPMALDTLPVTGYAYVVVTCRCTCTRVAEEITFKGYLGGPGYVWWPEEDDE